MAAFDFFEKTNVLRFPRKEGEEKNIQTAINQAKDYFKDSSIYIYPVAFCTLDYYQGVDFYVAIGQKIFPVEIIDRPAWGKNLINRGIEVVAIKKHFFPGEVRIRIIKKINNLMSKL